MAESKDGGNAFPVSSEALRMATSAVEGLSRDKQELVAEAVAEVAQGMSLRDYFAAKALVFMLSRDDPTIYGSDDPWEALSTECYAIADAMLKARKS